MLPEAALSLSPLRRILIDYSWSGISHTKLLRLRFRPRHDLLCGLERLEAARRLELVPAALAAYKLLLSAQTRRLTGWLCRFQE